MSTSSKTIVVIGATGNQGSAVIKSLLAATNAFPPIKIYAITRDITTSRAKTLGSLPGVTVIAGDLSDCNAIFDKINNVWGVYSVQTNTDAELQQGKAMIDAAISHGVNHFVYSSGDRGGPQRSEVNRTTVKNFAAKYDIEKYLVEQALNNPQQLSYTILRPVTFFENLTADIHGRGFARMWEQMGTKKKLQFVATEDIGWFAAQSLLHPDTYHNKAITLTGDELTQPEANAIFEKALGKPMPMAPCPIASAVKFVLKGTVGDMFRWFEEEGYAGDASACRESHHEMQDFQAWLERNKSRWV
jgi:uncharacterized protein YbjT (DUF2867 family)